MNQFPNPQPQQIPEMKRGDKMAEYIPPKILRAKLGKKLREERRKTGLPPRMSRDSIQDTLVADEMLRQFCESLPPLSNETKPEFHKERILGK